jgi:hypothetical protein
MIHYLSDGASLRSACGRKSAAMMATATYEWSHVNCPDCLTKRPAAAAPLAERRARQLAEVREVVEHAAEETAKWADVLRDAMALECRLLAAQNAAARPASATQRLSRPLPVRRDTPRGFLEDLSGFAAAQREGGQD